MAEWISVKDRLPEEDGDYLCFSWLNLGGRSVPNHRVLSFTKRAEDDYDMGYNGEKGAAWYRYDSEWGNCKADNVTHWMPLPEPPKEVG